MHRLGCSSNYPMDINVIEMRQDNLDVGEISSMRMKNLMKFMKKNKARRTGRQ